METGDLILLGLLGGGALWLATRSSTPAAAPPAPAPGYTPGTLYRGNDLGPFKPVLALPGLSQGYRLLAPVNTELQKVIAPISSDLRSITGMAPTTKVNPDGTITRTVADNWYTRNVGKPLSAAGSSVVDTISTGLGGATGALRSIF